MPNYNVSYNGNIDRTQILSKREVAKILTTLEKRSRKSHNRLMTLTIFRLTIGAGLRVNEISGLQMRDVRVQGDRPHIFIRREVGKGGRERKVPLWWDVGTYLTVAAWKEFRAGMGAGPQDAYICRLLPPESRLGDNPVGSPLSVSSIYRRWMTAARYLGKERASQLHPHSGRHTYGSYMTKVRGLAEVRDAMGHSNITTTSLYVHITPEDDELPGDVWGHGDAFSDDGDDAVNCDDPAPGAVTNAQAVIQ